MNFFSNTIAYYGESDAWSVLTMRSLAYTLVLVLLLALGTQGAKKTEDPKDCEVCVEVLEGVDKLIPSDEKSSKISIGWGVERTAHQGPPRTRSQPNCFISRSVNSFSRSPAHTSFSCLGGWSFSHLAPRPVKCCLNLRCVSVVRPTYQHWSSSSKI